MTAVLVPGSPAGQPLISAQADPVRTERGSRAIRSAAAALGLSLVDVQPVSQRRTSVYLVVVHSDQEREGFAAGTSLQAGRVTTLTDSIMPARETHRMLYDLHGRGAPVSGPRHRDIVATAFGEVGFWEWMEETVVTSHEWGKLTGAFHRAGRAVHHQARRYDPTRVFHPRIRRARELASQRGQPLFGAHGLVRCFESALDDAVEDVLAAAAGSKSLVLGDNQPGNVMRASGRSVLNDFERLASGPTALDLAAVVLGVQHFGYPTAVGEAFLEGYGSGAPTLESARPYARIRELSGTIIAMIQAGQSPEMEREMRVRTASIKNPGDGEPWTFVGNPDAMRLAG